MLEHLLDPSTNGTAAPAGDVSGFCGSLCGRVWQVFRHQASRTKHRASSIKAPRHQAIEVDDYMAELGEAGGSGRHILGNSCLAEHEGKPSSGNMLLHMEIV